MSHITATNNTWNGIYITGGLSSTYAHSIVMVNQDQAIQSPAGGSGSGNVYHDIIAANNAGGIAVNLSGSQASSFTGFLNVGPSGPTCGGGGLSGSCSSPLTSSFASAFGGKVTTNDTINTTDTAGTAAFAASLDWLGFQNPFRGWGKEDAAAFPSNVHSGACTSATCRIWDWRALTGGPVHNVSGNGSTTNGTFTPGSACPAAVDGNQTITANGKTYLKHAIEIHADLAGNNDGLCESGEICIYAPNVGSYQGEGAVLGPCTFTGGAVTGVQIYAFPTTGI